MLLFIKPKSMKDNLYSNKLKFFFRLLAITASLILISSIIVKSLLGQLLLSNIIFNGSSCILLLAFLFFPSHIEIFSFISGFYSIVIFTVDPENPMCVFLYFICISILYARGSYNKNRKTKNAITIIVFLLLWISQIRFGTEIFIASSLEIIAYSFSCICILFFFNFYIKDKVSFSNKEKILDLSKFEGLKKRDAQWLVSIKNKEKYQSIAIESQMTPGAVKNRLRLIYKILNVGDKTGFLNKYSDFKIIFGDDFIESDYSS